MSAPSIDGYRLEIQQIPHNADAYEGCVCNDAPWPGPPYVNVPDTPENRRRGHAAALEMWAALNAEEAADGE